VLTPLFNAMSGQRPAADATTPTDYLA